jgi:hypothetical protein
LWPVIASLKYPKPAQSPTVVDVIIAAPKVVNRNIEVNGTVVA